jgi:hypothetical protein
MALQELPRIHPEGGFEGPREMRRRFESRPVRHLLAGQPSGAQQPLRLVQSLGHHVSSGRSIHLGEKATGEVFTGDLEPVGQRGDIQLPPRIRMDARQRLSDQLVFASFSDSLFPRSNQSHHQVHNESSANGTVDFPRS